MKLAKYDETMNRVTFLERQFEKTGTNSTNFVTIYSFCSLIQVYYI